MDTQLAIEKFLLDCRARGLSPKTIRRYSDDLKKLTRHLTDSSPEINCITSDELKMLFAQLHEKLSPFSVEGIHRSLARFFHWCQDEAVTTVNPMTHVRKPKLPKRLVPRLNEQQVRELLTAVRNTKDTKRNLTIVMLMLDSGLRRGEVVKLKTENINRQFIRVEGKGSKERLVPISRETHDAIRAWIRQRPSPQSDHLFTTSTGKALTAEAIASLFRRLKKTLDIKRLYPHLLRHTFATLYLKRGDPKSLSQILGHSKISTTLDIYVDWDIETLIEKHRKAHPVRNF